ncbi:unnamed protein product [Lactuca saligna]|uniref:mRNA (guanine-N(7))-methyltransferase n=1 Tax=Lactuca saligna TaxID=75948 RepID=A0AA36E923_LACSI|nr:unnamed protein product [Lactuca saligna]
MSSASLTYASTLGVSLSRSTTPEPQIVATLHHHHTQLGSGFVSACFIHSLPPYHKRSYNSAKSTSFTHLFYIFICLFLLDLRMFPGIFPVNRFIFHKDTSSSDTLVKDITGSLPGRCGQSSFSSSPSPLLPPPSPASNLLSPFQCPFLPSRHRHPGLVWICEFLWQEGHTTFASKEEADAKVVETLELYRWLYEEYLFVPVVKLKKNARSCLMVDFIPPVLEFCFESEEKVRGLLHNVSFLLKLGGYLIGIILDSSTIWQAIMAKYQKNIEAYHNQSGTMKPNLVPNSIRSENHMITFEVEEEKFPFFWEKYQMKTANDTSAETHCLVHFPTLIRLEREAGLEYVEIQNLLEFYDDNTWDLGVSYIFFFQIFAVVIFTLYFVISEHSFLGCF